MKSPTDWMVRVCDVSKTFGGRTVLHDISFDVRPKTIIGIIGPNGAGKSVLVNILLGRMREDTGTVQFHKNASIAAIPQCDLADSFALPLSVSEFLKMSGVRHQNQLENALHQLELSRACLTQNFYSLSGGDRQKATLARALLIKPSLLVLDEPFSAVDYGARQNIYRLLKKINTEQRITIVLVSHDSDSIIDICDDILCLNKTLYKDCHIVEFMKGKRVEHRNHDDNG